MKKIVNFLIILLTLVFSLPLFKMTNVFADTNKEIYDFAIVKNGFMVIVEKDKDEKNEVYHFDSSANKLISFSTELYLPTKISTQTSTYALYDSDLSTVFVFDYETNSLLNTLERYYNPETQNSLKMNFISDIFGYENDIYAINYNKKILLKTNFEENRFEIIESLLNFNLDENSKLFVNRNFIYFSSTDGVYCYDLTSKNFEKKASTADYFFVDCHNEFNYLSDNKLNNLTPLNYNELIDFDRENGTIYSLNNSLTENEFNNIYHNLINSKNENIVPNASDFIPPSSLENYKILDINQFKFANNLSVFNSPYTSIEETQIKQNVIVIGSINKHLFEEYSYIVYYDNALNENKLGFVKSLELDEPVLLPFTSSVLTLTNFTYTYKSFIEDEITKINTLNKKTVLNPKYLIEENNENYYILENENGFELLKEKYCTSNTDYITQTFNPNAYIVSNSEYQILNTQNNEIKKISQKTEIQLIKTDDKFIYFLINDNGEILTCKALKENLYKENYTIVFVILGLFAISGLSLLIIFILLKNKKRKSH